MPGANCSVFGCGSCRRTKGIGIWKLPVAKDEAHGTWRDEWLGEIKKTREMDQNFREQLKSDRIYTCEKHFAPSTNYAPSNRKLGEFGAIFLDSGFRNSNQCVVFFGNDNFTLAECLSIHRGITGFNKFFHKWLLLAKLKHKCLHTG